LADLITPAYGFSITEAGEFGQVATQELFNWMADITAAVNNLAPLISTASPEGVLSAGVGRWCVDTVAGNIYYKQTGSEATGWLLTT
jgi:hypothetical protein